MRIVYIIIITAIVFSGCKKNKLNSKDLDRIQYCYNESNLDSLALVQSLIGSKWEWKYIECFWFPEDGNNDEFRGMKIEFLVNQIKVDFENQETFYDWSTESDTIFGNNYIKLETEPYFAPGEGLLIICDDEMVVYDSYRDICDNYFQKLE